MSEPYYAEIVVKDFQGQVISVIRLDSFRLDRMKTLDVETANYRTEHYFVDGYKKIGR